MVSQLLEKNEDIDILEDIDTLTDIVSHNLRSPVANILGLAKVLRKEQLPSSFRKSITEKLIKETETLDALINNINQEIEKQYN